MALNYHVSGFVPCQTGWTGLIRIEDEDTISFVSYTPVNGDSAASAVDHIVRLALARYGGTWSAWVTRDFKMQVQSSRSFRIIVTDNTATRTGFPTGTPGWSTTSTASSTHGGIYPSLGLGLDAGAGLQIDEGSATAAGGVARVGLSGLTGGTLTAYGSFAEIVGIEDNLSAAPGRYDVWQGGRMQGRYHVGAVQRGSWGGLASEAFLTADVTGST